MSTLFGNKLLTLFFVKKLNVCQHAFIHVLDLYSNGNVTKKKEDVLSFHFHVIYIHKVQKKSSIFEFTTQGLL